MVSILKRLLLLMSGLRMELIGTPSWNGLIVRRIAACIYEKKRRELFMLTAVSIIEKHVAVSRGT